MDEDRFTGYTCAHCSEEIKSETYMATCTCGAYLCDEPGAFYPCIEAHRGKLP